MCALSAYNYKVEASVGLYRDSLTPALCVFDTGAGPNLIRADMLPDSVLTKLEHDANVIRLVTA